MDECAHVWRYVGRGGPGWDPYPARKPNQTPTRRASDTHDIPPLPRLRKHQRTFMSDVGVFSWPPFR